ncbi:MAG: hypothetical protein M9894_00640 [Planctomycetes bacterium]|nr:hypothetical protein [Planctomycetota bacterium]
MATTGMETSFVETLLSSAPCPRDWEVGEALAECVLRDENVVLPWNTVRDRRSPRASLPGADIVGFWRDENSVLLLFGEVKSSTEEKCPPGVMLGEGGLTWQLGENATKISVQGALLKWLHARCREPEHVDLFREAVRRFVASRGTALMIIGTLIRDVGPNELDLKNRGTFLGKELKGEVKLVAWYLPLPIPSWPGLVTS